MSNLKVDHKSLPVRIMIVIIPIVVLIGAYFLLFNNKTEQVVAQEEGKIASAMIDPEAEKENDKTKVEVYEAEVNASFEKDRKLKTSNLDDIFASAEGKKEKEVEAEDDITANWGSDQPKKVEKEILETAPVKASSTKSSSTKKKVAPSKPVEVKPERRTGFYGSNQSKANSNVSNDGEEESGEEASNGKDTEGQIKCVINNDHVIRTGQTVRIRSVEPFTCKGRLIPKNTVMSGLANISNERAEIKIVAIKLHNEIIQCNYVVYDYDGVSGVYIPGGVNQELGNDAAREGVSVTTRVPIIGSSITTGGNKKVQDPTVKIPTGYKVYIIKKKEGY